MVTELASYLERLDDLRTQVGELVAELPAEALNWRPFDDAANSLAVLAAHIAGAERFWIGEVVGRRPPSRDREAEFCTEVGSAAELCRLLDQARQETHKVFFSQSPEDLDGNRQARGRTVPVRWAILHVIDHTALHLGHMQLTRQLWMGGQGYPAPRWFERLSPKEVD